MNPYNFAILFFSFCSFLISLFVWLKRQDGIGKVYFFFSSLAAIWGIGYSIMISSNVSYEIALYSSRILNATAVSLTAVWIHFTLLLTGRLEQHQKLLFSAYAIAGFICLFTFTNWFVTHLEPAVGFKYYTRGGPIFHLFTVFYFSFVPIGFFQLVSRIKQADLKEKTQLKGFSFATLAGFSGGAFTFLPCYEIMMPQYATFLFPIYPFVMAYFMTREQLLFDAEDLANAAHKARLAAIGTLAASINHEIRNPLYIIKGTAECHLANAEEGFYKSDNEIIAKYQYALKTASEQAGRAIDIMKRFAVFAKRKDQNRKPEAVNLNDLLNDVMPLIRYDIALDKIKLSIDISKDGEWIFGDRRELEEVFFNLIMNASQALKAAEQNNGLIEIKSINTGKYIEISISDNGPGMSTKLAEEIFKPFYTTKTNGTGLGLYITKQHVNSNNGHISVESNIGSGTAFEIKFPYIQLSSELADNLSINNHSVEPVGEI
jgi:signal transduction histidine kinase